MIDGTGLSELSEGRSPRARVKDEGGAAPNSLVLVAGTVVYPRVGKGGGETILRRVLEDPVLVALERLDDPARDDDDVGIEAIRDPPNGRADRLAGLPDQCARVRVSSVGRTKNSLGVREPLVVVRLSGLPLPFTARAVVVITGS